MQQGQRWRQGPGPTLPVVAAAELPQGAGTAAAAVAGSVVLG